MLACDERNGVLHAVMTSPPSNAFDRPLLQALTRLVKEFEAGSAKVLVLSSGVVGHFATGADTDYVAGLEPEDFADQRDAARRPIERLATCRKPSIAVIEGRALRGGLELAMACTLRFASPAATFGLPELIAGLIPDAGGTQRLPQLIGRGRALELMLTAREMGADEAARVGLVDRLIAGDTLSGSLDIARVMAQASGPAMAAIIHCVDVAHDLPHEGGMAVEGVAALQTFEDGVLATARRPIRP